MSPTSRGPIRRPITYLAMSCAAASVAVVGFSRRFLWPVSAGTFHAPAIVWLHGAVMFSWIVLLMAQATLIAMGRTEGHRRLGLAGVAIGTLVVLTTAEVAILLLARELKEADQSGVREFVADLVSLDVLVAGLFGVGIAYAHRPEIHKRLMLLTTFVILAPAFARVIQLLDGGISRLLRNDLAWLGTDAMVIIALAWDARARGRPHSAYVIGGAVIAAVQVALFALRTGPAWHVFSDWLAGLAN